MKGEYVRRYYKGVRTPKEIEDKLKLTQFALYYKRPDEDDDGSLVVSAPLMLGYKYSSGLCRHFRVRRKIIPSNIHPQANRKVWFIDTPDRSRHEFYDTLDALLKFLEIYSYILPEVEHFEPM